MTGQRDTFDLVPELQRPSDIRVIGVDCATQPRNVGLALCSFTHGGPRVEEVVIGKSWPSIDEQVGRWLSETTLIALDAPLGWPEPLSEALVDHLAGEELWSNANRLFRRTTDDVVAKALGKRPLDVGADRIARTAHTALGLIGRLRDAHRLPIPLAWEPGWVQGVAAIEVYPAGTLASRALPYSGYKGAGSKVTALRERIVGAVVEEMKLDARATDAMIQSDHVLDAVLCALAGCDFLQGTVMLPDDLELARREGWIWVQGVGR